MAVTGTIFFQLLPTRGPITSREWTLGFCAVLLVGAVALTRALPARARAEDELV